MTATIRITARVARRLLREVVAEAGRDYVSRDSCSYVNVTGVRPHCIVGRALARAGVTVDELSLMDQSNPTDIEAVRLPARVRLTWPARRVFDCAQVFQDNGEPWGVALDNALAVRPWAVAS